MSNDVMAMNPSYFGYCLSHLDRVIENARITLKDVEYDTMVGMGLSGALVIPHIAEALGKRWAIVRKDDGSHDSNPLVGEVGQKWLFVDDFISTGQTLATCKYQVERAVTRHNWIEKARFTTNYVGSYEYTGYRYTPNNSGVVGQIN